jgi:hypothetical protein
VTTDAAGNVYVADTGNHRIQKFANPPAIALISDVGNDQGRQARLRILRSSTDASGSGTPVLRYDVYRRIDPLPGITAVGMAEPRPAGVQIAGWEQVGSISARGDAEYNVVVPTLVDATAAALEYSAFFVSAATADPYTYFDSGVENGYSVDNLPPLAPSPFTAAYASGVTNLHWGSSEAGDFAGFRLYRGTSADFIPGSGNLVVATTDTGYVDAGAPGSWYKLSAVDRNGNESPFAVVGPGQTVDVPPGPAPMVFALDPVRPNPTRGSQLVARFSLSSSNSARLELLDVGGRRVIARELGRLTAGHHHHFELREADRLAPGLYLLRLTQGTESRIRRVVLTD